MASNEEIIENFWICPICSAEHSGPVINCHRCECQLLLLNKIKLTAFFLHQQGYSEMSLRFYDSSSLIE